MEQEDDLYHRCSYGKNKCGTRKPIDFKRNKKCICPTNKSFWREAKEKYKQKRKCLTKQ